MIKLDVCCGRYKHDGFVGMDKRALGCVDIMHDVYDLPWPVNDDSCEIVMLSLAWACIEPKFRIQLMDEFWRITANQGNLRIVDQYYRCNKACHDPTYYSCPNETTFKYFDPTFAKYLTYEPRPWRITRYEYRIDELLVVEMTPRKQEGLQYDFIT